MQTSQFRMWLAAALLAPVVATLVVRFSANAGPRQASADPVVIDPSLTPSGAPLIDAPTLTPNLSPKQSAARDWFAQSRTQVSDHSPMIRTQPQAVKQEPIAETPTEPEPAETPQIEFPDFRVTGMMTGGGVNYVSLNHKLARVGDEVAPGWRVRSIDIIRGIAVIAHADGYVLELFVDRPKLTGGE